MTDADTTREAVMIVADRYDEGATYEADPRLSRHYRRTAATLRALLDRAERAEEAVAAAVREVGNSARAMVAAEAERDAARAEAQRMRVALIRVKDRIECLPPKLTYSEVAVRNIARAALEGRSNV